MPPAGRLHHYELHLRWTGAGSTGTTTYTAYSRNHTISAENKPDIPASADQAFRGDPTRWSPEHLLLASLSACQQLWYLHLCADAGITVLAYTDSPTAEMRENPDGTGEFITATLNPHVTLTHQADIPRATALHDAAHAHCFIARSVNFPIHHSPTTVAVT
jgi:organic hydroperoxide reductase OsmC/OhrA